MQWEYKHCQVSAKVYNPDVLEHHGSQGWELVSVVAVVDNGKTVFFEAFFKRPKHG